MSGAGWATAETLHARARTTAVARRCIATSLSGEERRRHALLRRLLERIGQLDQLRLAARTTTEADTERPRLCLERRRKRRRWRVGHHRERNDDGWIAGLGGNRCAARAGEEDGVEPFGLHHLVDA